MFACPSRSELTGPVTDIMEGLRTLLVEVFILRMCHLLRVELRETVQARQGDLDPNLT